MRIERSILGNTEQDGNSAISYSLGGSNCVPGTIFSKCGKNMFQIDPKSGQISLKIQDQLNYAVTPRYGIDIVATDPKGLRALTRFNIRVIESNDPPILETFTFFIHENSRSENLLTSIEETA